MKGDTVRRNKEAFSVQAKNFEKNNMNFSKKEYLEHTVKVINPGKTDVVLDAAAGTCANGRSMAPFAEKVVCLDATAEMLEVGLKEAEKSGLSNMEFVEGTVEEMPFDDGAFDIVVSRLAFHHFEEPEDCFAEMVRVLKKGGKLAIIDMEAASEDVREWNDELETLRDYSHTRKLSRSEFESLFRDSGLRIVHEDSADIEVSLKAWLDLTETPFFEREEIIEALTDEMNGKFETGFRPFKKDSEIFFHQSWYMIMGQKD